MTQSKISPSEEMSAEFSQRQTNAFRIAVTHFSFTFVGTIPLIFMAWQLGSWQIYALLALVFVIGVLAFGGLRLIRDGRIRPGMFMVISSTMIVLPFITLLVSDLGLMMGVIIAVVSYVYASQTLQAKDIRRILAAGIVIGILVAVTDFLNLANRLQVPLFETLTPVNVALVLLAVGFFIARRTMRGSLRDKLLAAFIGVTVVATGALGVFMYITTSNNLQENLERELTAQATDRATRIGDLFNEQINTLTTLSLNEVLLQTVEAQNDSYASSTTTIQTILDAKDTQWRAADAANNNNHPLVRQHLSNAGAREVTKYQHTFPDNIEVFITDVYGGLVGSTNRTSDYYQADEGWWQVAYNNGQGGVYISEPEFDESANAVGVQIALPLRDSDTGEITGILRTTYILSPLASILSEKIGQTDEASLVLPGEVPSRINSSGEYEPIEADEHLNLHSSANQGMVEMEYKGGLKVMTQAQVQTLGGNPTVDSLGWTLLFHQDRDEAFAPLNAQVQGLIIVMLIVVALAAAAAFGFSLILVRPITQLTQTAEEVSTGNLDSRAEVSTSDEVGTLAIAFNSMTSQLQETLQGLEQRVAERTQNLELAAEVGRSVSQVRDLDVMLKDACDLILKEFDLYYVQVYLTDPSQKNLILEAGTGEVGAQLRARGHSLQLNTGSINGRAAIEKRSVVISDTIESATFRPNPLLPDTRGEMAVPLIVGDNVVGVLDMQTTVSGTLNEEVLPAFEALAGQLAVAIQNANLVAEADQARAEVEAQARRLVRTSWSEHMDAIHKPERVGFMFDRHQVTSLEDTEETQLPEEGRGVSAPISLTGEMLGSLVVELDDENQSEQTAELVNIVARQVAQQLENLRLLEDAERFRYEAEQASRRQTREGWQAYMQTRTAENIGYLYDLKEVRPHSNGKEDPEALTLPLKAREETVGKLSVKGLNSGDRESFELANAVVERLGAHIESLRLFEETKQGQIELDRRAQQLAAVAQVSTASSQELDMQKMLETVVYLTQRQFNLYHAHVFTYREEKDELQIVACGYREGDEHEGTHGTSTIPLAQEQSLVTRAARTRQAVIVNDVLNEPGWLPNPLLPDTRAELAVPLFVGDELLGVLDVQADHVNAFTEEDANIQMTLASQVATAMQNARSFAQAQKQAERETMLNTINQKIQSATSVEAVLQIAARELGHALGAPMTIAQLSMKEQN